MVGRCGWDEADAVVVELGISCVNDCIGLAVRERRSVASAFCHKLTASIARAGLQITSPGPDFILSARGLPEFELRLASLT